MHISMFFLEMIVTALVKYFFIRDQKETYSRLPRRKKFTKNLNLESVNVKDHKFGCIYLPYNSKTSSFKIKKSLKQQVKLLPNPNNFRGTSAKHLDLNEYALFS